MKASLYPSVAIFSAIVLSQTLAPAQVFPVAHCIEIQPAPPAQGNTYPIFIAHFGYSNPSPAPIVVPRGISFFNYFQGGTVVYTNQPSTFLPGYHPFATAAVMNVDPGSQQNSNVTWQVLVNSASLSLPTTGTRGSPLTVPSPLCSLTVTPDEQILSTTGTFLARPIASVRGDFSNPTAVVTPIGVIGGAGGISVSNLVYTPTTYIYTVSQRNHIPGKITADIAVSAWATPALFVFRIKADGEPTQLISVPISYNPTGGACASNVTAQTIVTLGGFSQNIVTRVWSQTVRVQNSGAAPIPGPVLLALDNLSANAALTGGTGVTNCATPAGSPYVSLGTGLAPGQTAAVTLTFTNAQVGQAITYTPRILSGGTQQ